MCEICDRVKPGLDVNEKSRILHQIGEKIETCQECADHFNAILDVLLETPLDDRDPLADSHWEEEYRNRDKSSV